jgi:DNA invertase Pin-like site-specific DNA recombinase
MGGNQHAATRARMVGYIRVSTEEQNLGPDAQRASLERWAMNRGLEIAGMFEDRGVSGATALDRRPGLLAAIESVRASGAKFLVAAKRDRFARDVILAAQLERLTARHGAQLISADGVGEGESPEAELMRRMVDAFASYAEPGIMRSTSGRTSHARSIRAGASPAASHNSVPGSDCGAFGGRHTGLPRGAQRGDGRR